MELVIVAALGFGFGIVGGLAMRWAMRPRRRAPSGTVNIHITAKDTASPVLEAAMRSLRHSRQRPHPVERRTPFRTDY